MTLLGPGSIRRRTTLALAGGLALILIAASAVLAVALHGEGTGSRPWHVRERMAVAVEVLARLEPALRPRVAAALDGPRLGIRWTVQDPRPGVATAEGHARHHAERLRRRLATSGVRRVDVGRTPRAGGHGYVAWIELTDGTWVECSAARGPAGPEWLFYLAVLVLVVGGGIAALGSWVARRVIGPLGEFAAAAARFGTDVEARPIPESGAREIRETARAFNQMQTRIRRFVGERMQTIAAISHDLRTPITRLRLRAEYIPDPVQREKALGDLDEMQAMLDATLAFARDDAADEARVPVDLAALLQSLCDDLADAGEKVRYRGPDRLSLESRPVALRRAFGNLLANAVCYGGEAEVTLSGDEGGIEVLVDDRGPGIPAARREEVFAPFVRLEPSRSRETGGTGLGLTVARTVVRGHGGDLVLEDREGGGLRARVTLPAGQQPEVQRNAAAP